MSYSVNFYRFAKKANSTKRPTANPDVTYQCEIMPGTSILAPTLKLNTNFLDPSNLTYAFIPTLTRYYFVSNWYYDRGLWQCDLQVDVLASYKTQIGNFNMYVLRSSYNYDGRIADTKYPIKAVATYAHSTISPNPHNKNFNDGWFVVGIMNGDAASVGVTSYYVFSSTEFRQFVSFLFGTTTYLNSPQEISDQLLKCLVNPVQYIVSCVWLPVYPPMAEAISVIPIGWWSVAANCHRLQGTGILANQVIQLAVPKHPQVATRGEYLLHEPYSSYYFDYPPLGAISISAGDLADTNQLTIYLDVDCITGRAKISIYNNPTSILSMFEIGTITGQLGVPINLAAAAPRIEFPEMSKQAESVSQLAEWLHVPTVPDFGWGSFVINKIAEPFNKKVENISQIGELAANAPSYIANVFAASKFPVQSLGGNQGFIGPVQPIQLTATFATIADDNTAEWGRPLCAFRTLSTIPGYIQCADADFEINCSAVERSGISNFLTGGFFYE